MCVWGMGMRVYVWLGRKGHILMGRNKTAPLVKSEAEYMYLVTPSTNI